MEVTDDARPLLARRGPRLPFRSMSASRRPGDLAPSGSGFGQTKPDLAAAEQKVAWARQRPIWDTGYSVLLAQRLVPLAVAYAEHERWTDAIAVGNEAAAICRRMSHLAPAEWERRCGPGSPSRRAFPARHTTMGRRRQHRAGACDHLSAPVGYGRPPLPVLVGHFPRRARQFLVRARSYRATPSSAAQQSVALRRAIALRRSVPETRQRLAFSLLVLGARLVSLRKFDDALATFDEAVALNKALFGEGIERVAPLATSVSNRGAVLELMGRREEAEESLREAVSLWQTAAASGTARSLTALLVARSAVLLKLNRLQDALVTAREAVAAGRQATGGVGPVRSVELSTKARVGAP